MLKIKTFLVLFVALTIAINVKAETTVKTGLSFNFGQIEDYRFNITSVELELEQSIYKGFGLGIRIRKDVDWLYSGIYLGLYPTYRIQISDNFSLPIAAGIEYGMPSSKYNNYSTEYNNNRLISHRWIYIVQNAPLPDKLKESNTGTIYPFISFAASHQLTKRLFIEIGTRVQFAKFQVESCKFHPSIEVNEESEWNPIYSLTIKIGYKKK